MRAIDMGKVERSVQRRDAEKGKHEFHHLVIPIADKINESISDSLELLKYLYTGCEGSPAHLCWPEMESLATRAECGGTLADHLCTERDRNYRGDSHVT